MNLEMVIGHINNQEEPHPHVSEEPRSGPDFDERALAEWEKLLSEFKRLDGHCIGNHLCAWTDPSTFSFGSQFVNFRYPIIETQTNLRRGLLRFCQSPDLEPPVSAVWAAPTISFHKTFCFKVWGQGVDVEVMQPPTLAGLILRRLHASEAGNQIEVS